MARRYGVQFMHLKSSDQVARRIVELKFSKLKMDKPIVTAFYWPTDVELKFFTLLF
jgi:hypothetical protein